MGQILGLLTDLPIFAGIRVPPAGIVPAAVYNLKGHRARRQPCAALYRGAGREPEGGNAALLARPVRRSAVNELDQ
jgi:hypothetical protein